MKRLGLLVIVSLFTASMAFAQKTETTNKGFVVNIEQLENYLQLASYQVNEVSAINEYFIQEQKESFSSNPEKQEMKMKKAVYGNLKLMKDVLTKEQYRKYIALVNVTNNNNRIFGLDGMTDIFLAESTF